MNTIRIFDGGTGLGDISEAIQGWRFYPLYTITGRYMSKRDWPTAWDAIPAWVKERMTHGVPNSGHSETRLTISEIKDL